MTTNNLTLITKILQLINLLYCLTITIILLSSNIKLFIFEKDIKQSSLLLFLLVLLLIASMLKPFFKKANVGILSLVFSILSVIFSSTFFYDFINWWWFNVEGVLTFKSIQLVMTASFEAKVELYTRIINTYIETLGYNDIKLHSFLQKSIILNGIIPSELASCIYKDIPLYAQTKIDSAVSEYNMLLNLTSQGSNIINYKIMTIFGIIVVAAIFYYVGPSSVALAMLNKKTQELMSEHVETTQQLMGEITRLNTLCTGLLKNLDVLSESLQGTLAIVNQNDVVTKDLIAVKLIVKNIFQNLFQVILPFMTNQDGTSILFSNFTPEVKDFIFN